jgi:thiamine-phosphate pyrophosphorylase
MPPSVPPSRLEPTGRAAGLALRRGLYAIVDVTSLVARGLDPVAFARAVLEARPAALQVRAKELEARELLALLRAIAPLCRGAGVPLVANDRVDLAVLAGTPYVHVGQTDLAVERVRRVAADLRVGVSTHTPEQLAAALEARPDYVAYGPVFPTVSKAAPDPCVGLAGLAAASAQADAAAVPLVAIGGVTLERAPDVARWATAAAVIHALLPASSTSSASPYEEVTARSVALHAALGGALPGAVVGHA